jgi:hypothetical protein
MASLAVGAFALLIASPAHAQAIGDTTISIDVPDIVILHYFSTVDVAIGATAMEDYLTGAGTNARNEGGGAGTAAENGGQFDVDLTMAPGALSGDPTNAVLLLQNAWGVRAISGGPTTQTQVAITVQNSTLSDGGSSSIEIVGANVDAGAGAGPDVAFTPPGLSPAVTGDVLLTLDFSNTTTAGSHTGGVFRLTASNI